MVTVYLAFLLNIIFVMGSRRTPYTVTRSISPTTCCCLHLRFLQTVPGTLKLAQLMIGSVCEALLVSYGRDDVNKPMIGPAILTFLNTVSSCIWTTTLLMTCYIISHNSYGLIRSSLLELMFSLLATLSLCSSSIYMCASVSLILYPLYETTKVVTMGLAVTHYPAIMASYMLGFILTALYGLDAYHAYCHFKGYA
ncbi:protein singles bar-like isoform X1 [Macrosteles quadrilineatus]|uniref:protein singles bar-like isoform X1 n=2 Tax=Macrosteles quadrilineatus TaxID=74068 RepID=UPI0023E299A4|nr:protein singles bar-like isoform X1 [Macrosteles quadrilineatus]